MHISVLLNETIENLNLNLKPDVLQGKIIFEVDSNTNIAGIKDDKGLYTALGTEEKHYITDKGEFSHDRI